MLALGTIAPDFTLPNVVSDSAISLADFAGQKALLIIFASPHCPFVKHIQHGLAQLGQDYANSSLAIVAISANDPTNYPDDAPDKVRQFAESLSLNFPFLFDETQEVAKAYQAACTPDFFLFDGDRKLVYRGQFDDSRPSNEIPVTGQDLRNAIDAVLADQVVPSEQKASIGCNIKWKVGHEPPYYNSEPVSAGVAS